MTAQHSSFDPRTPNEVESFKIAASNVPSSFIEIKITPSSTENIGIDGLGIASSLSAQSAISSLQNAINQVGEYRAHYGAKINALQSASRSSMNQHENLSAARSRIQDADYAIESAKLVKNQIIQQAAQAVLTQANTKQELALSLLK